MKIEKCDCCDAKAIIFDDEQEFVDCLSEADINFDDGTDDIGSYYHIMHPKFECKMYKCSKNNELLYSFNFNSQLRISGWFGDGCKDDFIIKKLIHDFIKWPTVLGFDFDWDEIHYASSNKYYYKPRIKGTDIGIPDDDEELFDFYDNLPPPEDLKIMDVDLLIDKISNYKSCDFNIPLIGYAIGILSGLSGMFDYDKFAYYYGGLYTLDEKSGKPKRVKKVVN